MNPDTRKKIILAVLMLLAAGVVVYQLTRSTASPAASGKAGAKTAAAKPAGGKAAPKPGAAKPAPGANSPESIQEVDVNIDELLKEVAEVNFDYQSQHIDRDPMTPLVGIVRPGLENAKNKPSITSVINKRVTGIIYDPADPVAVVDDEVVHEGYVYPDGTVVNAIDRDKVVFKVGDSLIPVEMKKLGVSF